MDTFTKYLQYKEELNSFSDMDYEKYTTKKNIEKLCSDNPFLKKLISNVNGMIFYLKGMEWDIDLYYDEYYDDMFDTFLYVNPDMRWTDRKIGRPENTIDYDKGDGECPCLIKKEFYNIIKKDINNVRLSDGNYLIGMEESFNQTEFFIVEPHRRNDSLFKEYLENSAHDYIKDNFNSPDFSFDNIPYKVKYSDEELNNFYHNRPNSLKV